MKNKKEAAEYLGISPRALEYHVKQGNIGARKERGQTGDIAVFDDEELRRLKAQIDDRRAPRPAVVKTDGHESPETESRSLTRLSDVRPLDFAQMIAAAVRASSPVIAPAPGVPIEARLMLSLADAAQLAGLSRDHLRGAIKAGKLKAKIIGRGWRVKRTDLDAYVRKL